jgi:hypothetical protein
MSGRIVTFYITEEVVLRGVPFDLFFKKCFVHISAENQSICIFAIISNKLDAHRICTEVCQLFTKLN